MQSYLKVFVDWGERYQKLTDAEFGRLIRAAIAYKATDVVPELNGREELLWDGIKIDIDRDNERYNATCSARSEAGRRGAEARWNNNSHGGDGKNSKSHLPYGKNSQDKEKDKEKDKELSGFDEFWAAYPRKTGKGEAKKAWAKIRPDAELLQQILAAVEWQSKCDQWQRDNGQYIPYPATWLNQQRWEDEDVQITTKRNKSVMMGKKDESSFEAWKSALRKVPMN